MSSIVHIYLGPYVQATYRAVYRSDLVAGCMESTCENYPRWKRFVVAPAKFCPACGGPAGRNTTKVLSRPDLNTITSGALAMLGGDEDASFCMGPNVRRSNWLHFNSINEDGLECHLDLSQINPAAEVAWFKHAFRQELAKLQKAVDDVQVLWGFHRYWV